MTTVVKGQRVVPFLGLEYLRKGEGTWQDYVSVRAELVWVVPDSISDVAAAQFVVNPWTVHGLLSDLKIPKGEYVLQTAAGSTLSRQLIKLAKHWGIKTINVVRRKEQKAELKALGADEVISTSDEDVVTRVKEITGGKLAYGALDAVGDEFTKQVLASVRDGGQVFIYGVLEGWEATVGVGDLFRRNPRRGGRQQPHQTLKKSKKYKGGKKHDLMVTQSTPKMPKWHHSALKACSILS